MSYILIQNDGEIELGAFELIGASTKRNQTGKIGFFGSGLKYSIAYMMRSNIGFRIFSGEKELRFEKREEILRDQKFERVCINGSPTSYTTTMGPTWNEAWFVIREIYCNALDELNCQIVKSTENINSVAGKTRIYIQLTDSLQSMIENWDAYFCSDRTPLFEAVNAYTSYIGTDDINGTNIQTVQVYKKTEGILFRRGIRFYSNKNLFYDYGFQFANINEDRTIKNPYAFNYTAVSLMAGFYNEEYVTNILREGKEETMLGECSFLEHTKIATKVSEKWIDYSKQYLLVIREQSGRYIEQMKVSQRECLFIPSYFGKQIKKAYPEIQILGLGKSSGDVFMTEIEPSPKISFLLKQVVDCLQEMRYMINYPISIVRFEKDTQIGHACLKEKQIYLADKLFNMGKREIALTLIEENEHINSGYGDETRAFQNHLISLSLKHMEESNALFL